jgi:hypothetical protein
MCCIFEELTEEEIKEEQEAHRLSLQITQTRIFARHTRPGYQAIVYNMVIASERQAAMILPIPVAPGSGEEALIFHDLSAYPEFFTDLDNACLSEQVNDPFFSSMLLELGAEDLFDCGSAAEPASLIQVHEVGDYEASYVPTLADFHRLDPCFRMPDEIWRRLPIGDDYGFAVFQLRLGLSDDGRQVENDVHPMAFEFPTRDDERLFYPTVHVHDRMYHNEAGFHHRFYCQRENARAEFKYQRDVMMGEAPTPVQVIRYSPEYREDPDRFTGYDWYYESRPDLDRDVDIDRCHGLVAGDQAISKMTLEGEYPNQDIWLHEYIPTPEDILEDGMLTEDQIWFIRRIPRTHVNEARFLQTHGFELVEARPWGSENCYFVRQVIDFGYDIYQLRKKMNWEEKFLAEGDDMRVYADMPAKSLTTLTESQLAFLNSQPTKHFSLLDEEFQLKGIEIVNVEWDNITVRRVVDYEFDIDGYLAGKSKQYGRQITLAGS